MRQVELKTLKSGEYERASRKYSTYKYEDVNRETLRKGSVKVYVEIY